MKIVVDTNIVFSCILNSTNTIGKILLNSKAHFQFYSCEFLRTELFRHKIKLLKSTKLKEEELSELQSIITGNITFINELLLPEALLRKTENLLRGIDLNDTPFVALTKHLNGKLWTGDMQLYNGLRAKRFKGIITTSELSLLLKDLENA